MTASWARCLLLPLLWVALPGCSTPGATIDATSGPDTDPQPAGQRHDITECREPRPEICTQDYRPVCATRGNGVRCVVNPCPATETATYSNGCTACSDPRVFFHVAGACPL